MRTVIARIFDYSLDGVIATEGTSFFDFCRDLPDDQVLQDRTRGFYEKADLHIMGRKHPGSGSSQRPRSRTGSPNSRSAAFARTGALYVVVDSIQRGDTFQQIGLRSVPTRALEAFSSQSRDRAGWRRTPIHAAAQSSPS
jgi:hypothetical protein